MLNLGHTVLAGPIDALSSRLKRLAPVEAALARLHADRRFDELLRSGSYAWSAVDRPTAREIQPASVVVSWSSPSAQLVVIVPSALDAYVASVVEAKAWPMSVRMACLNSLLEDAMPGVVGWAAEAGLKLSKLSDAPQSPIEDSLEPMIVWRSAKHRTHITVRTSDVGWVERWLAALQSRQPRLDAVARLAVPVALVFSWRRFRIADLRALEVGDVVLGPRAQSVGEIESACVVAGRSGSQRVAWRCSVRQSIIELKGDDWMSEHAVNSAAASSDGFSSAPEAGPTTALGNIEVDLHLELQMLSMPVGELANLRAGYVLELPVAPEDAEVQLVVGGQLFGRAQLVCIGDRLGAQILELVHDAG